MNHPICRRMYGFGELAAVFICVPKATNNMKVANLCLAVERMEKLVVIVTQCETSLESGSFLTSKLMKSGRLSLRERWKVLHSDYLVELLMSLCSLLSQMVHDGTVSWPPIFSVGINHLVHVVRTVVCLENYRNSEVRRVNFRLQRPSDFCWNTICFRNDWFSESHSRWLTAMPFQHSERYS